MDLNQRGFKGEEGQILNPKIKCTKVSLSRPKSEGIEEVEKKGLIMDKSAKCWVKKGT
jgi:hypothetical protein